MTRPISPSVVERIVTLSRVGVPIEAIAEQANCSKETVKRYRKIHGVSITGEAMAPLQVRSIAAQRRLDMHRLATLKRLEHRGGGVAALIGPPIPPSSCRYRAPRAPFRCRHELADGLCPVCEREERRLAGVQEGVVQGGVPDGEEDLGRPDKPHPAALGGGME